MFVYFVGFLFSPNLFDTPKIIKIMTFLFKYAAVKEIPERVYDLIQMFFNYHNSLPNSKLEIFLTIDVILKKM